MFARTTIERVEDPSEEKTVSSKLCRYFEDLPKVKNIPTLFSLSLRKIVSDVDIIPGSMPMKLAKSINLIKEAPGTYKNMYLEKTLIDELPHATVPLYDEPSFSPGQNDVKNSL